MAHTTHLSQHLLDDSAPANKVDLVPNLTHTLLSGSKFADAGYTAIYDKDEVNFYDSDKFILLPHPSSRGIDALALDFGGYHYLKLPIMSMTIPSSLTHLVAQNL